MSMVQVTHVTSVCVLITFCFILTQFGSVSLQRLWMVTLQAEKKEQAGKPQLFNLVIRCISVIQSHVHTNVINDD